MSSKSRLLIFGALMALPLFILTLCKGADMSSVQSAPAKTEKIPKEVWSSLAKKRIYFGHMSVGNNILDGVRDLMQESGGADLKIRETADPAAFKDPIFAHSPIGKNTDPLSKIQHFQRIVETGIGEKADIAFFKLCFVDIHGGTDIEALIRAYDEMMQGLQTRFPKLTVASVTAPLTAIPTGFKESFKKLLGMGGGEKAANVKREVFNAHLREKYGKLVFDLAALESTGANGQRTSFVEGGKTYYALDPAYTDDGGHLSVPGGQIVAAGLLRFLAELGPTP
jgi:hypothetical protein